MPTSGDIAFTGLNLRDAPHRLQPGELRQADNFVIEGGSLVSRPGIVGLLTTLLPGTPYCPTIFENNAGAWLVCAAAGALYKIALGADGLPSAAPVAITLPFSLVTSAVQLTQYGGRLYGCDGSNPLFFWDGAAGGAITGLIAPTPIPGVSLTSEVVDAATTASDWAGAPALPISDLIGVGTLNGSFETGTTITTGKITPTTWTTVGPDVDAVTSAFNGGRATPTAGSYALLLDTPDSGVQQDVNAPVVAVAYAGAASVNRVCRVLALDISLHNDEETTPASVVVQIIALDASNAPLATWQEEIFVPYDATGANWTVYRFAASFTALGIDPTKYRLRILGGGANPLGVSSVYCDYVKLRAAQPDLKVAATGATPPLAVNAPVAVASGDAELASVSGFAVGGAWIRRSYTALTNGKDFSTSALVSVGVNLPANVVREDGTQPRFRFGFTKKNTNTVVWTNPCALSTDGRYLTVDASTVPADVRAQTFYFWIQAIPGDDLAPGMGNGGQLFAFGPLSFGGSLSVGYADYSYLYSERREVATNDYIDSSGSPVSALLTPTNQQATALVDLDAGGTLPQNTGGTGTTHYQIWRQGGTFSDGSFRLVATVPIGANASGTGWSWDFATKTLRDNVPDGSLNFADVYERNRDNFPAGCSALAVAHGRLFALKGATVYASWLLSLTRGESGLYTSFATDPNDDSLPIKGATLPLSTDADGDKGVQLVAFSGALVVLRRRGVSIVNGYSPENFAVVDRAQGAGIGCAAARSAIVAKDGNAIIYLAPGGLLSFDLDTFTPVTDLVAPLLVARDGGPLVTAAIRNQGACVLHDRRLMLFTAPSGGAANTLVLVFDYRQGGWTTWTPPSAIVGAFSWSSASRPSRLYLACGDNQIYTLATGSTGDKATPATSAAGFAVAAQFRALGQGGDSGDGDYLARNNATRFSFDINTAQAVTTNLSLRGDETGAPFTVARQLAPGDNRGDIKAAPRVRGRTLTMSLAATVADALTVRAFSVSWSEGRSKT